jgi:hypothetical protein
MTKPVRLQLSRRKGFDLQQLSQDTNGLPAVNVARPSKWGNPCKVGRLKGYTADDAVADFRLWVKRDLSVRSFENVYGQPPTKQMIRDHLRGKNLACWCELGEPCHAETLIEIANR